MTKERFQLICKYIYLAWFGGTTYITLEVFFRGYSHWTMFVLAAFLFITVGLLNKVWSWELGLIKQIIIATATATISEFIVGCIVNLWLGWNVWNYSGLWGNILGQICPQFVLLWIPLMLVAIVLDDVLRWKFFNEEAPRYRIGKKWIYFGK